MRFTEFKSVIDLVTKFDTEQKCIDYLTNLRWVDGIVSPFDPTSSVYVCKGNKYKCRNTNKYFNVRTGTMFDDTKLPLQKWFMAIYLMASHKKGISSYQLARDLGITQKSAWFMLHRIRYSFSHENVKPMMKGTIEVDETFVGGKAINMHKSKRKALKRTNLGLAHTTPVLGILERGGTVQAHIVKDVKQNDLLPIIKQNVDASATIVSDGAHVYKYLKDSFAQHEWVAHSTDNWVKGEFHTNTLEGFWSLLKRGIYGIYHQVTPKHLDQYLLEFTYRYNSRDISESERFALVLSNAGNKRLRYKKLVYKID